MVQSSSPLMLKQIIKTSFFSLGSRGFLTITNLALMFAVARRLDADQLGIYSITAFFYYLFSFFTSFELTGYFGKEAARPDSGAVVIKRLYGEIGTTFLIGSAVSLVILPILMSGYRFIDPRLLAISAISGMIFGLEKNMSGILLGRERMDVEFAAQGLAFALTAVPVFFFITSLGVEGLYYLRAATSALCILFRSFYMKGTRQLRFRDFNLEGYNWKEIKFFSASGFAFFAQHHLDVFILSFMVDMQMQGAYFLAVRIFLSFNLMAEMISLALTPYLSRTYHERRGASFRQFHQSMFRFQIILALVSSLALFLARDLLIAIFAREENVALSSDFLMILSLFFFFRFVSYYTGNVLSSTRYAHIRFYILMASAVLFGALGFVLGGMYSVRGIIYARGSMEVFIFLATLPAVRSLSRHPRPAGADPAPPPGLNGNTD